MPLKLSLSNWKHRVISGIKKSEFDYGTQKKLIHRVKKYKKLIPNYERAKKLHEKQKSIPLTIKEGKELTKRLKKFDQFRERELKEIKD